MLPTAGLRLHVTAVFVLPRTAALNFRDCDAINGTLAGVSVIVTGGISVIRARADFEGFATLVAFTVRTCVMVTVDGAV